MKDQIQFETNGLTVLAVNIAPDASDIRILEKDENYCKKGDLVYKTSKNVWGHGDHVLPECKWKIHAVTTEMTEEQANVLVKYDMNWDFKFGYQNYEATKDHVYKFPFDTAIATIPGLLRSHGIDPAEKWVLLIKE